MWRYEDAEGGRWDVVVGRESWGAMMALFVPRGGAASGVRQTPLGSASYEQALQELEGLGPAGLGELFSRSKPKPTSEETDAG